MDADTKKTAKPSRRGLRFSLRTLLIVVTVLSILLGWFGWRLQPVRRERATITWVEEMQGKVGFTSANDIIINFRENSADALFGKRVRTVNLANTRVSDLSPLAELKSLKKLRLNNTHVSDLSPLAELISLKYLNLQNTQVSYEQVLELRQALPNCWIIGRVRVEN